MVQGALPAVRRHTILTAGDTLPYSLVRSSVSGGFRMDTTSGFVFVRAPKSIDCEKAPVYRVAVVATDAKGLKGLPDSKEVESRVGGVNVKDPPAGATWYSVMVVQDAPVGPNGISNAGVITLSKAQALDLAVTPEYDLAVE